MDMGDREKQIRDGKKKQAEIIRHIKKEVSDYVVEVNPQNFQTKESHEKYYTLYKIIIENIGIREVDGFFHDVANYNNLMGDYFKIEKDLGQLKDKLLMRDK